MSATRSKHIGLGLIGAGGFGNFCIDQYRKIEGVRPVAVADIDGNAARQTAEAFDLSHHGTPDALLAIDEVDVVHIATPPSTHTEFAMAALKAGKHVLTEKPLATNLEDARAILNAASEAGRIVGVNLIMRYNPLCQCVARILESGLIGKPLHAFFENYASDEKLPPSHWFWNREISGGIFIEHGVHFFDLFESWFGRGEVEMAQAGVRPDSVTPDGEAIIEQVSCSARYPNGVLANFYHGFHQCGRMDRQEARIVCERGSIRLFEWIPTRIEIDTLATRGEADELASLVPDAKTRCVENYAGSERDVGSRHKNYHADGRYRISGSLGGDKQAIYSRVVRDLLEDQIAAIESPHHERAVTGENGYRSLEMAVEADSLARRLGHAPPRQQLG